LAHGAAIGGRCWFQVTGFGCHGLGCGGGMIVNRAQHFNRIRPAA
jgi:hypothetical protein